MIYLIVLFVALCAAGPTTTCTSRTCTLPELADAIRSLSEQYRPYTAQLLSAQTKVEGFSLSEKNICLLVKQQMEEAGFDEVRIDGLGNVIGRIGSGRKVLAIDGHIDTVGTGELSNWDFDPFSGTVDDEYVYGRGTVDQRGGIAAFIAAGRMLKDLSFDLDLTIYFVASVIEEDCDGLCWKYIIEEEGLKPDWVISTEATEGKIYRGQRGRMEINVEFRGVSSHGSAPQRGVNAIYMASRFALEVEKLNERLTPNDFLGKGTIAISEFVSGSPSLCAVADYAKLHMDRRLTLGETSESAVGEVQEIVDKLGYTDSARVFVLDYLETSWTGKEYGMVKYYPTWVTPENHVHVQTGVKAYEGLYGKKPGISRWVFSTNCIALAGMHGVPCIGFGPGSEVLAHAPNEKVKIDDLVESSAFYAMFIHQLAKGEVDSDEL